jgi:subtilisin family serine protease
MKEKHIILRIPRVSTRDVFLGEAAGSPGLEAMSLPRMDATGAQDPSLEVDDINRRDITALTKDNSVVAIAPAMPMKLVEPIAPATDAQPMAGNVEWGISAVGANTSPFSGDGVIVAVLDTGIDPAHPAFAGVDLVRKNFTTAGDDDQHGHGTHCAGTIFGRNTNGTRIGVAPGVKRAIIGKVLGPGGGSSDQIASAVLWAVENGAQVISMSLGIDFPGFVKQMIDNGFPPELATSRALEGYRLNVQLFEKLASLVRGRGAFSGQPTLLVAAAGNESQRNTNPDFEIAVSPPAVSEGMISVAALGKNDPAGLTIAYFSNTGANLSGPGVDIVSAKRGGGLASMSGTSMATPHIAGLAALWAEKIKQTRPLSAFEWLGRLTGSATSVGLKPGFDPFDVGAGLAMSPQA